MESGQFIFARSFNGLKALSLDQTVHFPAVGSGAVLAVGTDVADARLLHENSGLGRIVFAIFALVEVVAGFDSA